jgi:hypothetical protein
MHLFPDEAALTSLYRRDQIRLLSLFGSTLKGTNRRRVDLRTAGDLSRSFGVKVVRAAETQFAA